MNYDLISISGWQTYRALPLGNVSASHSVGDKRLIQTMRLTFKFPVYPTQTQETTLSKWLDHLCELQNSARHDRMVAYEIEGAFVSLSDQQSLLTQAREKYEDFREVPQDFQNHALRRNDKAFANFRRRCKEKTAKKGYPRYKKRVRSLTWSLRKYTKVVREKTKDTDKQTIRVRENPIIETTFRHNGLKVPKLGEMKIYMHRPLQGDPKEITLVKKASGWYAHISCDIGDTPKVEPTAAIAVDMGTTHYLTTSEGEKEDNPKWYREAEGLLRKHSKDLSRKKKGSQRWRKAVHAVALHHERTANKRKDFIGKLVYKLFHHDENNVLIAEDLGVSNMVRNEHLSKSISDASWATFFESCGLSLDRDHNAALNILFRAAAALRGERWVATLCEARNKNEARDPGLQNATQLLLFGTPNKPESLGLGS